MKLIFLILSAIFLFSGCGRYYNEPLNNEVSEYIRKTCPKQEPCKIKLKDATNFDWDKFIFFDIPVENKVITSLTGKEFSSKSPYYSRKWFFYKDNEIVRSEEQVLYEIDVPFKDGDVDFDPKNGEQIKVEFDTERIFDNFAFFPADATFELERNEVTSGEFYRLHYVNCR